jgi:hypothetical protein
MSPKLIKHAEARTVCDAANPEFQPSQEGVPCTLIVIP